MCGRTTDSPIEVAGGDDGVCLPLNAVCATNDDCTSPVFTECSAAVNGSAQGRAAHDGQRLRAGQVQRARHRAASRARRASRDVLPMSIPAPDVCSPICTPVRDRKPGQTFNECLPGLTCLSDAFPQTDAPACAPGFPGWLCVDKLGCTAGGCYDWGDTSDKFKGFETCAPPCKTDDDCVPFDRGGNPKFLSHNICHEGVCRDFSSLFFPMICTATGPGHCKLDPEAKCVFPSDGHGHGAEMGLGAFGGAAAVCVHGCSSPSDCDTLAGQAAHPDDLRHHQSVQRVRADDPRRSSIARRSAECYRRSDVRRTGRKGGVHQGCDIVGRLRQRSRARTRLLLRREVCLPKAQSGNQAPSDADACLSGKGELERRRPGVKCVEPDGLGVHRGRSVHQRPVRPPTRRRREFGRCR